MSVCTLKEALDQDRIAEDNTGQNWQILAKVQEKMNKGVLRLRTEDVE